MPTFDPPGYLDDLDEEQRVGWADWISSELDSARQGSPPQNNGPRLQFFNSRVTPPSADAVEEDIAWTAFPRQVQISSISDLQRWKRADATRDVQDEYCEWSVSRDDAGKVVRATFTCEGPEYWHYLAAVAPGRVLSLYQHHVDATISEDDIFPGGVYAPRNAFNNSTSLGAMHLIQGANTLQAEIELAGGASLVRARADGSLLTDSQELIKCSQYGAPNRHSDPHIGERANFHARAKADITLANPIGLYFDSFDATQLQTPDGSDPNALWRYTRGSEGKFVRLVVEAPAGTGFVLGDVEVNGRALEYGGQLADLIRIKLTAVATRIGQSTVAPTIGCRGEAVALTDQTLTVAQALHAAQSRAGRR